MNCEIVNAVNLITNGSTSEINLSFDVKNKDVIIGTCEMSIENVFMEFELKSDKGKFSFKPNKEAQKDYFDSENVDNSKGAKVNEEDVNKIPESLLENQRPENKKLDRKYEDIVIKFEEDFFFDPPPSNYLNEFQDNVVNQSSTKKNRGENHFVQIDDEIYSDTSIIKNQENILQFGLNLDVHTSKHSVEKSFE